jgi:hypothetical protein
MRHDHGSDSTPVEANCRQRTLDDVRHAPGSGVDDRRLSVPDEMQPMLAFSMRRL